MSNLLSSAKKQENLALAQAAYEKAKRKAGTTLLRWKPDWEQAARHYRDATKYFKLSGDTAATIQALRESAIAHEEIQSFHTAAADLEAAAQLSEREEKNAQQAMELYQQSSKLYRTNNSYDKAAAMLVKAAESIGDVDAAQGVECMKQACGIFEEENRGEFHDATFKKAICFCVNRRKYGPARAILRRQIAIAQKHINTFEADIYKNLLSIVVLRCFKNDYEKAAEELREFEGIERFARSEECLAANELIQAWQDGNEEALEDTKKKQVFKYLLNPIAVLVRKIKFDEETIARGIRQGTAGKKKDKDGDERDKRRRRGDDESEPEDVPESDGDADLR